MYKINSKCGAMKYALVLTSLLTFSVAMHHHKNRKTHSLAFGSCRENICASRVSACLLMGECDCSFESCHCCADCMRCLANLWKDCCDCVGLCMPPNKTASNEMAMSTEMSTVGDLREAIPSLFKALSYGSSLPVVYQDRRNSSGSVMCQVAFYNDCKPLEDCVSSCRTMGANRYRWFHNSCCQCVGDCLDYGEGNPQCKNCLN